MKLDPLSFHDMGKGTAPLLRTLPKDGLWRGNEVAPIRHISGAFWTLCQGSAWSRGRHFAHWGKDIITDHYFLGKIHWPPACEAAGVPFFHIFLSISLPPSSLGDAALISKLPANHFVLGQIISPG